MRWPTFLALSPLLLSIASAALAQSTASSDPSTASAAEPKSLPAQSTPSLQSTPPAHSTPAANQSAAAGASDPSTNQSTPSQREGPPSPESAPDVPYQWLDRTREALYGTMWRSAEHVDRWFGSERDEAVYQKVSGSIAPALLYTQYDGLHTQVRFNMNFALPEVSDRIHAFVGRFDPNEFITERDEPSGSIPRTYGPPTEDQTLLGIGYRQQERQGDRFEAGAGVRLGFPMDPYVKGSYVFERGRARTGLLSIRETLFWQNSDGAGETTRFDLERIFNERLLLRYTLSGTKSQMSEGLRGYTSILLIRGLNNRRALAFEVGLDGQTSAPVPLHDYGFKIAFRQSILRRWLILEVRSTVDWPKDYVWQHRSASVGVGIGLEMLIGTEAFLARPVTF